MFSVDVVVPCGVVVVLVSLHPAPSHSTFVVVSVVAGAFGSVLVSLVLVVDSTVDGDSEAPMQVVTPEELVT